MTQWTSLDEAALREQMVRIGQLVHTRNYVAATDGNLSVRLDDDHFLVTPSGVSKGLMTPGQMVVIDWDARPAGSSAGLNVQGTTEILLHLEAYRQRPDVGAVVHAHPPTTVALSIAGVSLARCVLPEVVVTLGLIPNAKYATPASAEGAEVIRDLIRRYDALVLPRHGTVTVGRDLTDAYLKLEKVENAAEVMLKLLQIGREEPFPPGALEKLIAARQQKGLMREGQLEEILAAAQ
jgi:L-fuculose-phosphate aldolase